MRIQTALVMIAIGLQIACLERGPQIAAPTTRFQTGEVEASGSDRLRPLRPIELDLSEENTFLCSVVSSTEKGPQHSRIEVSGSSSVSRVGRGVGRFRYVRWGRASRQRLMELVCVVPLNNQASHLMRAFAVQLDHRAFGPEEGEVSLLAEGSAILPKSWGDDFIHCLYDPNYDLVECEGETCSTTGQTLRAEDFNEIASHITYYCPNGCDIIDFTVYSCPTSGGGSVDYGDGYGSSGGGSGTNSYTDTEWCPMDYPNCLWELRPQDQARLDSAFAGIDRNANELCGQAADSMLKLSSTRRIYRGNPSIPDRPNGQDVHRAEVRSGPDALAHIDQDVLESVPLHQLGEILVHEGMHLMGIRHDRDIPYSALPWPFTIAPSCAPSSAYVNH